MTNFFNIACFFCTLCAFLALTSLVQTFLGIYFTFMQNYSITIHSPTKTDKVDSYPAYVLFMFIGIGSISLILSFFSMYAISKRNRPLSLFVAVLWVFTLAINFIMFTILFLYYYVRFPNIHEFLVDSIRQSPSFRIDGFDYLQLKNASCGRNSKDDHKNLSNDSLLVTALHKSDFVNHIDANNNTGLNNANSSLHADGCSRIISTYLTVEMWMISGVICACILLQILAITFMCVLNQRYQKLENQNFTISKLDDAVLFNESINNNNMQNSCKTIEDVIEVTQI